MLQTRRVGAVFLIGATLVACSGSDHPPPLSDYRPLPECPQLDLSTCDTRKSECQERLLAIAVCLYGVDETPHVPVQVLSETQLLDQLNAEQSAAADPQDAKKLPHIERALVDLRLLQVGDLTQNGGETSDITDRIDGVYQNAEQGITLVDRGMPKSTPEIDAVLIHEFTHAIQDARYGLDTWRKQHGSDVDTNLALLSLIEGQATYSQFRALYAMSGVDLAHHDLKTPLESFRSKLLLIAEADPSPYFAATTTFPYAVGVMVAHDAWHDRGQHFDDAEFEHPPLTSFDALDESYSLSLPAAEPMELAAPVATADYEAIDDTSLGAFMLDLFSHQAGAGSELARKLSLAWKGDHLWIYADPNGDTAWLWEIALSDPESIASLSSLDKLPGDLRLEQQGSRLFLANGAADGSFLLDAGRAFLAGSP